MQWIIIVFGALTALTGLVILVRPALVFGPLERNADRIGLHVLAVIIRLIIGVLLIQQAGNSGFPMVIEILGWLSLAAATAMALMGRSNFKRLMSWAFSLLKPYGRLGGIFATAFGAFLVYAFV